MSVVKNHNLQKDSIPQIYFLFCLPNFESRILNAEYDFRVQIPSNESAHALEENFKI